MESPIKPPTVTPPPVEALTRGVLAIFSRFSKDEVDSKGVHLNNTPSDVPATSKSGKEDRNQPYREFLKTLKQLGEDDPQTVRVLTDFVASTNSRALQNQYPIFDDEDIPGEHEELAEDVKSFLASFYVTLLATRFWRKSGDAERVLLKENLERLVMSKIYAHVFAPTASHKERDEQLHRKIAKLAAVLDPVTNLDMKAIFKEDQQCRVGLQRAGEELGRINLFKSPREKMACVTNLCRIVMEVIKSQGIAPIPDVFIPCLVHVICLSNPQALHSNIEYIAAYRNQDFMMDERGHFFLHLASAVGFLWRADHIAVSMDQEEFETSMYYEAPSAIPELNDTLQTSIPFTAQSISPKANHSSKDVEMESGPHESRGSSPFGSDLSSPQSATSPVDPDWLKERFGFESMKAADLRVGDIEKLLRDYQDLVGVCKSNLLRDT